MRIVVTGAAGFIGSVLCRRAAERGHEALAVDDLSRGMNQIQNVPAVTFVQHDCQGGLTEAVPIRWLNARDGIGAVVHLAAGTGSLDRPIEELRALNVEMTKRVYADAHDLGARVFAFPTTSLALAVPDSPYVRSKEEAFEWVKRQDAVPVLPLRLFNVAGAYKGFTERRRREVHLVPRLAACLSGLSHDEVLTVNGDDYDTPDGTPSRDFVHVLDVVDFVLANVEAVVESGALHPAMVLQSDGAAWVGTGWLTTVRQAAAVVEQWFAPMTLTLRVGPRRPFDCGVLACAPTAPRAVRGVIGRPLAPAWVGIRDEVLALLAWPVVDEEGPAGG